MSGGSFDHAYGRVEEFADSLERKLRAAAEPAPAGPREDGEDHERPEAFIPAVTARLQHVERMARHLSALMKEVEWLYSGDNGEESFLRNYAELEKAGLAVLPADRPPA